MRSVNYYYTTSMELLKGNTGELTATVSPANASIEWKSSNSAIASVEAEEDGRSVTVTAVVDGSAEITVTATSGKLTASETCIVNVKTVAGVDSVEKTEVEVPETLSDEVKKDATPEEVTAMTAALNEIQKEGGVKVDLTSVASSVTKNANGDIQIEGADKVIEAAAIEEATKKLNVTEENKDQVRTVIVPLAKPEVVGAEVKDNETISVTYELKAFAAVYVTTQSDKEDFDSDRAEKAGEVQITDTEKPVLIELKVETTFFARLLNPVVKHPRRNGTFWHKAFKSNGIVSFTNRRGFSEISLQDLSETPDDVQAEYNDEYYSLEEAIRIAENKSTITVKKDGLSATVSKELTFKLGDNVKTLTITEGSGYTKSVSEDGKTITVTKKETSSRPSGGGGGGGSSKPAIKPGEKPETPGTTAPSGGVAGFNDVAASAWYADSVQYVVDKGLFGGVGNGNFAPNANMTRAMMWTVLARYKGVNTNTGSNWYEAARTWAIAQGISDGTMADGNVTREQFVTMLWRLSGEPSVTNSASFTDSGKVSSYAKTAVDWAVSQGIVNGYNDGSFKPQGSATRAEVAKMLTVFCSNAETEG